MSTRPLRHVPVRHCRIEVLFELAKETGMIDRDTDLIEGMFWNPGSLSYAAAGVQAGAQTLYSLRNSWRQVTGSGPRTTL